MHEQTLAIHEGYDKDKHGTMSVPIYQTTAYDFGTADTASNRFALSEFGPIYTRLNNPTTDIFESRIAALENGAAALTLSSGQSATYFTILNLASVGENIVVAKKIYGGTTTLLTHTLKRLGIEAKLFDSDNADDLEALIDDKTRAIFFETLSNPQLAIPNLEKIVKIAQKYEIVTVADNTVATPVLFKPLINGVDIVVHSASKYISGNGSALGGVIIERKGLNELLKNNPRYAHFNEPDASYHGIVYSTLTLPIFTLRARLALVRDIGAVISPFNSWLLIQGLETLHLRMREHSKNAQKVAEFLSTHTKVKAVYYPGLKNDAFHDKSKQYFKDGLCSGLLSFEVKGGVNEAKKVLNSVKIFSIVVNIGDTKSIITHPASTTHQQVDAKLLESYGISSSLIRLSVGLEYADDLIDDLKLALEQI